jgi:hypothetical protein
VNAGMTAVRDIVREYHEHVGLKPQKKRPVMIITEDIQMLKEQFHLHFGSTWQKMKEKSIKSTFAARTVSRSNTGTQKFLDSWDSLPEYVSKTVAKGALDQSFSQAEIDEEAEAERANELADEDDSMADLHEASQASCLDNAVRSWERGHEAKEGKLSELERAVCKELMTSCFDRVSVLHEKRVLAAEATTLKESAQQALEDAKEAKRVSVRVQAQQQAALKEYSVKSIHGERLRKRTQQREFLVHWKGFNEFERDWELESNLSNCDKAIGEFRGRSELARARASKRKKDS